jgi:hypothetical protein
MARYNDGTTYNSGARYAAASTSTQPMSMIKINVSTLNKQMKAARGLQIIAAQTGNPNVPGNTVPLADFATEQTSLEEALALMAATRIAALEATAAADAAVVRWLEKLTMLAAFTETATGGDAAKIISAGFQVKAGRTPAQLLPAVEGLLVELNGEPGHADLSWTPIPGATGYMAQGSPDPITPTSWTNPAVTTKAFMVANGAAPGEAYWYRVAAFNAKGQGPWSAVAPRPVM